MTINLSLFILASALNAFYKFSLAPGTLLSIILLHNTGSGAREVIIFNNYPGLEFPIIHYLRLTKLLDMPLPFINEHLLQFIWQHQYFNKHELVTSDGDNLQIIYPGTHNLNQGPDFLNGRIRVAETNWAGNIELHIKTSDYYLHKHHLDNNYNNIILHVVWKHDDSSFKRFPVLELEPLVSNILLQRYASLQENTAFVACAELLSSLNSITWTNWKERLVVERLQEKTKQIHITLEQTGNHWEEVFWRLIARNFGYKINADLFEAMACTISVNVLAKQKNQQIHLEAMLMGQANLLNKEFHDEYPRLLQREYRFLKQKLSLPSITIQPLFLRMRPANVPTIRLSQLASLIHKSHHLFSLVKEAKELNEVKELFSVTANDYWHYHYNFSEETEFKPKHLGATMVNNILINTVIPVVFAYGQVHGMQEMKDKAIEWLNETEAEVNSITAGWKALGVINSSAFDSQSLLHLKKHYCISKRCLECAVGNAVLRQR